MGLLVEAVAKNTSLTGIMCSQNMFNFPSGGKYDPASEADMKQAIIQSPAPLETWNNKPLPRDVVAARAARVMPF